MHKYILFFLLVLSSSVGYAQRSAVYSDVNADYKNALDLYDKAKFAAARVEFESVIARINNRNDEVQVNAEYYMAVCALELFNKDAEYQLIEFVRRHPESPRVKVARFQLGRYYYRRKKFKDALEWFEKVDEYDLSNEELSEFYFKKGYSYFRTDDTKNASRLFYEIKDTETEYRDPARYFYAHIAYTEKKYQTALEGFLPLKTHAGFGKVVPFYITQIYYMQEKYDEVIEYAGPLIDTARVKREGEIARLIGESYYRTDRYAEAVPYLEKAQQSNSKMTREDRYQLGFAYTQVGEYDKAIAQLNLVTDKEDELTQMAYYHMGDAYLKAEKKSNARNAFLQANALDFDPKIVESALYNYAKLSYELDYDPFNLAIGAFEKYLNAYPNSPNREEVYDYLLAVYMKTNNFDQALISLEKIKNKDLRLKTTYQLVAYNSAVGKYNRSEYTDAIATFDLVSKYPVERAMVNDAVFWKGESYYLLGEFENAIVQYNKFKTSPGAILSENYHLAEYNMAYAYMKKRQYNEAIPLLRNFSSTYKEDDRKKLNDAFLRIGDCYFIATKFADAVIYYDKALKVRLVENDYASLQKATCLGYLQKRKEKIETLEDALRDWPNSKLAMELKYQLADVYRIEQNTSKALKYYNMVLNDHPTGNRVKAAMTNAGLIQYRGGQKESGIALLVRVARESVSYADARDALKGLEQIYANEGTPELYLDLVRSLPYINMSNAQLDSLTYATAEKNYFDSSYDKALAGYTTYLNKFPNGIFSLNARYYRADCHLKKDERQKALPDLEYIVGLSSNLFTEDALLWAAQIRYQNEEYSAALSHFMGLENIASLPERTLISEVGLMDCFDKLGNCSSSVQYADKVLANALANDQNKENARMIKGRCSLASNKLDAAFSQFEKVAEKSRTKNAAESKYQMAYIWFLRNDYKKSDKAIKAYLTKGPQSDHWVAMCFLLLAENSIAQGDYFQAKATLKSVIENHNGAELVQKAQERLDWIIEQEAKQNNSTRSEPFDVKMDGYEEGQENLYQDDGSSRRQRKRDAENGTEEGNEDANNATEEGGQR